MDDKYFDTICLSDWKCRKYKKNLIHPIVRCSKVIPPYKLFHFCFLLYIYMVFDVSWLFFFVCVLCFIFVIYHIHVFDGKCCNRLFYNSQFQIKYMNKHVYIYFIVLRLNIFCQNINSSKYIEFADTHIPCLVV